MYLCSFNSGKGKSFSVRGMSAPAVLANRAAFDSPKTPLLASRCEHENEDRQLKSGCVRCVGWIEGRKGDDGEFNLSTSDWLSVPSGE